MKIDDVKLPMDLTLTDMVRMEFVKFLRHNELNSAQNKDGTFVNDRIQTMWISCRVGANAVLNVMEDRIHEVASNNQRLQSQIHYLAMIADQSKVE